MSKIFKESLKELNESQLKAVNTLNGPVLLAAGPGTGKTQVLSLRIGQILTETDMYASNILCLTFSRSAVNSMEQRLAELLGPESENVTVETFHSFAEKILLEKSKASAPSRMMLTKAQRYMILEKLLSQSETGVEYFDGRLPDTKRLGDLCRLFDLFKKESVTADEIKRLANHCLVDILPTIDKYKAKRVPLNENGKRVKNSLLLFRDTISTIFEAYQNLIKKHGFYDYDDLIIEATNLLLDDNDLLLNYQVRYQYILVDEFQDTNESQLSLLLTLLKGIESPNVFVVGDDDQCIYRFQGASKRNFEILKTEYKNLAKIALTTNYRSTTSILEQAHLIITENQDRDPLKTNPLIEGTSTPWKMNPAGPYLNIYDDNNQEDYDIALNIKKLAQDSNFTGSIAVLYRRNLDGERIAGWLDKWGIPYKTNSQRKDLLQTESGKNLIWSTRVATLFNRDIKLSGDYFCHVAIQRVGRDQFLKSFLKWKKDTDKTDYLTWLIKTDTAENITLIKLLNECISLEKYDREEMSLEILNTLFEISTIEDTEQKRGWIEFVEEFLKTDREKSFSAFCSLLHYHEVRKIGIEYNCKTSDEDKIILSTIWSSKGLEYDVVFIKDCTAERWENHNPGKSKLKVPALLNEFIPEESDNIEDLRRLIYVAFTRSKCVTHFSYAKLQSKTNQCVTKLLQPLIDTKIIKTEEKSKHTIPSQKKEFQQIEDDLELRKLVKERIENFAISASCLYKWLEDMNQFFIQYICKAPDLPEPPLTFGTYVHEILKEISSQAPLNILIENIRKVAERIFLSYKEKFHKRHEVFIRGHAVTTVYNYFKNNKPPRPKSEFERYLTAKLDDGTIISGQLDRIEICENSVLIIDYKTGKTRPKPLDPFISEEDSGDPYWRQAVMYEYIARKNFPGKEEYKVEFHYVEQGKTNKLGGEGNDIFFEWIKEIDKEIKCIFSSKP